MFTDSRRIIEMNRKTSSRNLLAVVQGFMANKQEQLGEELAEKYGVTSDEAASVVESFLVDTYGPAEKLVQSIAGRNKAILLFIGKKDCKVCNRCEPILESFLSRHRDVELVKLDYSMPEGLLYHMIHDEGRGLLPMIAFIFQGAIGIIFTGECRCEAVYEQCYSEMLAECSQNIYPH
jgi:hypothetical protein